MLSCCSAFSSGKVYFSFIVFGLIICFCFRREIMLVTDRCFHCCWAVLYRGKETLVSWLLVLFYCWWVLRKHKLLTEGRTSTADLDWPKGYSISWQHVKNLETWWELAKWTAADWGLSGHQLEGSEQLLVHLFLKYVWSYNYYYHFFLFLF